MRAISPRQNRPHVDVGVGLRRTATGSWPERSSFRRDRSGVAGGVPRLARDRGRARHPRQAARAAVPEAPAGRLLPGGCGARSAAAVTGRVPARRGARRSLRLLRGLGAGRRCAPRPNARRGHAWRATACAPGPGRPPGSAHRQTRSPGCGDVACTTPVRTAFDLARRPELVEAAWSLWTGWPTATASTPIDSLERCERDRGHRGVARVPTSSPWPARTPDRRWRRGCAC